MAFNPSPEVADCRDVAKRRGYTQVIQLGIIPAKGGIGCRYMLASYGETTALCADAKEMLMRIEALIQKGEII